MHKDVRYWLYCPTLNFWSDVNWYWCRNMWAWKTIPNHRHVVIQARQACYCSHRLVYRLQFDDVIICKFQGNPGMSLSVFMICKKPIMILTDIPFLCQCWADNIRHPYCRTMKKHSWISFSFITFMCNKDQTVKAKFIYTLNHFLPGISCAHHPTKHHKQEKQP